MHAFRLAIVHTLHVSILLCRLTAAATQGPMLLSQKHREADFSDNASIEYAVFMLCISFSAARRAPFLAPPSSRERERVCSDWTAAPRPRDVWKRLRACKGDPPLNRSRHKAPFRLYGSGPGESS